MGDSGDESDGVAVTFSHQSHRASESDLRGGSRRRRRSISTIDESYSDERTGLLSLGEHYGRRYNTQPATPRPRMSRVQSAIATAGGAPTASRTPSFTQRLSWALSNFDSNKANQQFIDDRVWYDQVRATTKPTSFSRLCVSFIGGSLTLRLVYFNRLGSRCTEGCLSVKTTTVKERRQRKGQTMVRRWSRLDSGCHHWSHHGSHRILCRCD
jgi:hypothetical protein